MGMGCHYSLANACIYIRVAESTYDVVVIPTTDLFPAATITFPTDLSLDVPGSRHT